MRDRAVAVLVAALAGAFASSCQQPQSPRLSEPATKTSAITESEAAGTRCESVFDAESDDAPVVVLYEERPWSGSDFPTVALWRDGAMVFVHDGRPPRMLQTTIPADEAARVVARVAAQMRDVRVYPYPDITEMITDIPTVEILVRDGPAWRFTSVYGVTREWSPPQGNTFVAAYKELLALRPDAGLPFQPRDVAVVFFAADKASGESVPWPSDVPTPPAEAVPGPIPYVPQWRVVPVEYLPALRDLMARVSAAPSQTVTLNGQKWSVQLKSVFRGQATALRAIHCARRDPRIWGIPLTPDDRPGG